MRVVKIGIACGLGSIAAVLLAQTFTPSGESDPDVPAQFSSRVNKADYLQRRAEWVALRRGIQRGKRFDPSARGRALRQLNRQEGIPDNSTSTLRSGSNRLNL